MQAFHVLLSSWAVQNRPCTMLCSDGGVVHLHPRVPAGVPGGDAAAVPQRLRGELPGRAGRSTGRMQRRRRRRSGGQRCGVGIAVSRAAASDGAPAARGDASAASDGIPAPAPRCTVVVGAQAGLYSPVLKLT